jgi:hypothetical protein
MAPDNPAPELEKIGTVIARSLAFLCLQNAPVKDGTLLDKARFLSGLGLPYEDTAGMLGTTVESVRVQASKAKSGKGKKRGNQTKSKGKAKRRTR